MGISGCVEHCFSLLEIIKDAKARQKTVHIIILDLSDAFGSLPHNLVEYVLGIFHVPNCFRSYIISFFACMTAVVRVGNEKSEPFRILTGGFQGDPLVMMCFIMCYQPVFTSVERQEKARGYSLRGSEQKHRHVGLVVNARKSISLSISRGVVTKEEFVLGNQVIPSVLDCEDSVFLGMVLPTRGRKNKDHASYVKKMIEGGLGRINNAPISAKSKLTVTYKYFLPSIQHHLAVHDVSPTSLAEADHSLYQYLKTWLKLPKCTTNSFIHHRCGLNLPSISFMCRKSKVGYLANFILNGDELVLSAVQSKLERQKLWTRNKQWFVGIHDVVSGVFAEGKDEEKSVAAMKKKIARKVSDEEAKEADSKLSSLLVQGRFFEWSQKQNLDYDNMRAVLWGLPDKLLRFAIKARVDVLPTGANLKRWSVKQVSRCALCGGHETLLHSLNWCKTALDQGRFTWRHDSILLYIHTSLLDHGLDQHIWSIYTDLYNLGVRGGGTIPDVLTRYEVKQRPDLVLVDYVEKSCVIFELTVPFETNVDAAHKRKENKYRNLCYEIEAAGFSHTLLCFEVGSRGIVTARNVDCLRQLYSLAGVQVNNRGVKHDVRQLSRLALNGSYVIFHQRRVQEWLVVKPC